MKNMSKDDLTLLDLDAVNVKLQHLREIRDEYYTKSNAIKQEIQVLQKELKDKIQELQVYQKQIVELNEELTEMQIQQEKLRREATLDPEKDFEIIRSSVLNKRRNPPKSGKSHSDCSKIIQHNGRTKLNQSKNCWDEPARTRISQAVRTRSRRISKAFLPL